MYLKFWRIAKQKLIYYENKYIPLSPHVVYRLLRLSFRGRGGGEEIPDESRTSVTLALSDLAEIPLDLDMR